MILNGKHGRIMRESLIILVVERYMQFGYSYIIIQVKL